VAGRKWADDVEINLLHVANHDIDETPEQRHARHGDHETAAQHKAAIRQASMYALEARAKYLGNRMGVSRFSCRVEEGKASTAIVEAARKLNADLIIMGSHGHAARALRVLGSTTSEVTAKAPCSVEVVRVPHSLLPGHEGHDAPEHMDTHVQIIDKAPRRDDRPHVPPASFM
jgi:nucleotide-binding universal stress UspA family protein